MKKVVMAGSMVLIILASAVGCGYGHQVVECNGAVINLQSPNPQEYDVYVAYNQNGDSYTGKVKVEKKQFNTLHIGQNVTVYADKNDYGVQGIIARK